MYNQATKRLSNAVEIPIIGLGVDKMTKSRRDTQIMLEIWRKAGFDNVLKMLINNA